MVPVSKRGPGSLSPMERGGAPVPLSRRPGATGPDEPTWIRLDEAYAAYLDAHPAPPGGSLLAQTILTGPTRRSLLSLLEVRPGEDVLDLGTGFGPVVLEMAHRYEVHGVGIDVDQDVLAVATSVAETLGAWLCSGSSVRFERAEVEDLPFADGTFDVATARLLFQHVVEPRRVVAELWRVLRRGARVLLFDVDDGLSLTYPLPSPDLVALEQAFAACQSGRGGDREVGRKLTTYFAEAGFEIRTVQLLAQAQHQASAPGDPSRLVNAARLRAARDEIVRRGLLGGHEFDRYLTAYESEPPVARFRAESQLVVVAERP